MATTSELRYIVLDRRETNTMQTVTSFAAADTLLRCWSRSAPGGEDVRFTVLWADERYDGEYRIDRAEKRADLRGHIKRFTEFVAPFHGPEKVAALLARLV